MDHNGRTRIRRLVPDETAVVYTSDVSGHSQVYVAVIP